MTSTRMVPASLFAALVACGGGGSVDSGPFDTGASDSGPSDAPSDAPDVGPDAPALECEWDGGAAAAVDDPPISTPRWAFEPWISKDISDRADTEAFVQGFVDRDIPVSALVLDSPWETQYHTFVPSPERYGDFPELVTWLHDQDIRIVLWMTQMVNVSSFDAEDGGDVYRGPSPNFSQGRVCDFYIQDGATFTWWKGRGAGLDFFNPEAVAWWRSQYDPLLDLGVDGWKLDFGESYIRLPEVETAEGTRTLQQYSEEYYRSFYSYGRRRLGDQFVTMVRGWDVSYDLEARFYARPEHAPVVWMGDNHRDWSGLVDALDHTFRSAQAGYVVVGSDIGGYLDRDQDNLTLTIPFDQEVFARWVAVEAMTPFFQLHGRANLEPWNVATRPEETVELYRYWAKLHSALVPFWFSLAEQAYAGGANIVRPIGATAEEWAGDFRFAVGDAFLVAPILESGGRRDVELPSGAGWYDWWQPAAAPHAGGTVLPAYDASDRRRLPLFVRAGAIVPMHVVDDANGLGTEGSAGHLTVLVWPDTSESSFTTHDEDDEVTVLRAGIEATGRYVALSRAVEPVLLRVHVEGGPDRVTSDGADIPNVADRAAFDAATIGWFYEAATSSAWIKLPAAATARRVALVDPT